MQTSMQLTGANCPTCFNDTLDDLKSIAGVRAVHGSIGGSCLVIDHDELAPDLLAKAIGEHLHGVEMFSNEVQMVSASADVLVVPCALHSAVQGRHITPDMTLGDIVTANPSLAPELQRRGFDFCCHGGRTLTESAGELNLDPDVVATELSAVGNAEPPAEWASLSPLELIDHIVAVHHRYLWDELPRIDALVAKIVSVHGQNHPELAEVRDRFVELRADFEPHLKREEDVVFPALRELAGAGLSGSTLHGAELDRQIDDLTAEHEVVGELLEELRRITDGYTPPADGCATYAETYRALGVLEADTHLHVHKESNVLIPALRGA